MLGLDAMRIPDADPVRWEVRTRTGVGGGQTSGLDAIEWAARAVELGAGEIVVNSMDADGTQAGYDIELLRKLSEVVTVPVVASGGAGSPEHMLHALQEGRADAGLAASIFHYGTYSIAEVKAYLSEHGVPIRPI